MNNFELLVLSVALGTDLFSVSIPIGMNPIRLRLILKAALVFAVFHIIMILTGYYGGHWLGAAVESYSSDRLDFPAALVQNWASVLGAVILGGLGIYMIKENLSDEDEELRGHPLQGLTLVVLAASVSVDALAAGFSLGMMDVDLVKLSLILGLVIFFIAVLGLGLGRRIGRYTGARSQLVGGVVLIGLALHVLWRAFS